MVGDCSKGILVFWLVNCARIRSTYGNEDFGNLNVDDQDFAGRIDMVSNPY
jgi:hypothetical protein